MTRFPRTPRLPALPLLCLVSASITPLAAQACEDHECKVSLPASLKQHLTKQLPDYLLPTSKMLAATENPHCPPMIKGDFNGDKAKDYALLLVGKNRQPQLVAALKSRSGWHTALLPTYCTTLDSCYLEKAKPGTYRRTQAIHTAPAHPDDRATLTHAFDGIISGTSESTGIFYAPIAGKWPHVWIED